MTTLAPPDPSGPATRAPEHTDRPPAPARDARPDGSRLGLFETVTVMVLPAVAALGWSGVFPGVDNVAPLAGAGAAAALGTTLLARTQLGRGTRAAALLASFAVVAAVLAERRPPTPAALADVITGLRDGWAQILDTHLPVEARGAPLATALAVVWAAGCLSSAAQLAGRPVLRLVPPLAALATGLAFGASGAAPPETSAAVVVAAMSAVIVAARTQRPAPGDRGPGGLAAGPSAGSGHDAGTVRNGQLGPRLRAAAMAAVVVAVVAAVGTAWPGASAREPYDPRQLREPPVVVDEVDNPLAHLGGALSDGGNPELFRAEVRGEVAGWTGWRVVALDQYDPEQGWTTSSTFRQIGAELLLPAELDVATRQVEQVVTLCPALQGPFLPAMASPVDVDELSSVNRSSSAAAPADGTDAGQGSCATEPDPGADTATDDDSAGSGDAPIATDGNGTLAVPGASRLSRYRVLSAVPDLDPARIESARPVQGQHRPDVPTLEPHFQGVLAEALPPGTNPSAAGRLAALRDWFLHNLRPADTSPGQAPPPTGNGAYHLGQLFEQRFGTAEQIAAAFALLAQQQGFEARVVAGYRPGDRDDRTGELVVHSHDAHAWPEVRFEDIGWVAFDPTPQQADPSADTPTQDEPDAGGSPTADVSPTTAPSSPGSGDGAGGGDSAEDGGGAQRDDSSPSWVARTLLAVAATVAVLLLLVGSMVVAKQLRRRRQQRGSPAERVAGAWSAALDRLAEGGVKVPRHLAAGEVVTASGIPGPATQPLSHLAEVANACRFSGAAATEADATTAWDASAAVAQAVRSHRPTLRLILNPAPLLPR